MDNSLKIWFLFYFFYYINCQSSDPYLSQCGLQYQNNTYVNKKCDRIPELSIVKSFYDNENFVCVILDNRNGRYLNQIIQMKISKRNNYKIEFVSRYF